MDTKNQPPVSKLLRSTPAVPIAQLSPDDERLPKSSIHSVVTLLWPYSSSTKTLRVFLAEPDFRLRRSNGQVKVFFHGHVAEEVARTHIGIGDTVYLSLAGSRLAKNDADSVTQTPGRSVSWDVHFEASAFLEIWRGPKFLSTVKVDRSSNTPPPADNVAETPSTPAALGAARAFAPSGSTSWQSPAFLRRSRVPSDFVDLTIDPFVEEDGYVPGKGRKRPRFSIPNSEWRVVDEPESPGDRDLPEDWMAMFDEELGNESEAGEETVIQDIEGSATPPPSAAVPQIARAVDTSAAMVDAEPDAPPLVADRLSDQTDDDALFVRPTVAPRSVPELARPVGQDQASHLPMDTPRLRPVPSPGLPHPSPLTTTSNSRSGYFGSAIDAAAAAQSIAPAAPSSDEAAEPRGSTTLPQVQPHAESPTPAPTGSEESGIDDSDILTQAQPHDEPSTPAPSEPEEARLDDSDNVLQDQAHDESVHIDEDDVVTVSTDDMQILPSERLSARDSADATSSLQSSDRNVATVKDIELDETQGEPGHSAVDSAKANIPEAQPDESCSGSEQQSEIDEDDSARRSGNGSGEEEEDGVSDEWLPQRLGQEDKVEQKKVSADRTEEGELATARGIKKHDKSRVERKSLSSNDSRDKLPTRSYDHYFEDDNDDDGSDEDASKQGEYEEDNGDDADDDRDGEEYEYYGSEIESDYEEESPPRAIKHTVPEVIVLDSDSEDDLVSLRLTNTAKRQAQDSSSESSYGSEDQSRSGDGLYDEADQEGEEDMDFSDRSAMHDVKEEPENLDDEEEDHRPITDERPVDGWHSEPEQTEENPHDALHTYKEEDYHVQPNMKVETTSAEPPLEPNQNASLSEFVTARNYREGFHIVTEYPPAPNHDSLDYLAAISESAERLHAISESAQPTHDLAIDPSLYGLGNPQDDNMKEPDTGEFPGGRSVEDSEGAAIESPRSIHERHMALRLDGAASGTIAHSTEISVSAHETRQLITPGPSQLVVADQASASDEASSPIEVSEDILPTRDLTHDILLKSEIEDTPRSPTAGERVDALERESPSPIVAVKSEPEDALIVKREGSEPEPPMVVVDNGIPASPDEDQKLQASIEVDDQSQDSIDDMSHAPGGHRYPGLRSKLSYFAPLATLIDHYNALVDTISIASEVNPPTKAGSGSKDFIMTLQLTDPSMAGASVYAQLLRPYKSALPSPREGDAILLRNLRVKSFNHSVTLVSDSTSSWAVFSSSTEDPDIAGPPVEYGVEENEYATDLRQWYLEDGVAMVADCQLQASVGRESRAETPTSSLAHSDAGSIDMSLREARGDTSSSRGSRRKKSHRRITIHELRDGRRYTEVGSTPGVDSIHELRDGTVYANL
ncbi:hypothetical protein BDW71DRAFT_42387 [Aspergillus fruticulosus]